MSGLEIYVNGLFTKYLFATQVIVNPLYGFQVCVIIEQLVHVYGFIEFIVFKKQITNKNCLYVNKS